MSLYVIGNVWFGRGIMWQEIIDMFSFKNGRRDFKKGIMGTGKYMYKTAFNRLLIVYKLNTW